MDRAHRQPVARPAAVVRNWNNVYTRFRDWAAAGVWNRLFEAVSDEPDMECAIVDATMVNVHRHGQGVKGGIKVRRSAGPRAA